MIDVPGWPALSCSPWSREVPAHYYWVGGGPDNNWSTLADWRLDSADPNSNQRPSTPPGSGDEVEFSATAPHAVAAASVMDGDYVIGSLIVGNRAGEDAYHLTLNGTLSINSMTADPTLIDAGGGVIDGAGPMTFTHVETGNFTWDSGKFATTVKVTVGTVFHMGTDQYKGVVAGEFDVYTSTADWDGLGVFEMKGQDSAFVVQPGGRFTIARNNADAVVQVQKDNWFVNRGTLNSNMGAGTTLRFGAPGREQNAGTWNVNSGDVLTRNLQNSGTITIADGSRFLMGAGDLNTVGTTILDSTQAPAGKSVIRAAGPAGTGKAIFFGGSTVQLSGSSNQVQNADDLAALTMGDGNLTIVGNYTVGSITNGQTGGSTTWSGAGTTGVGSADGSVGQLTIYASLTLKRPLTNAATVQWLTSGVQGGPPTGGLIRLDDAGTIINGPGASFTIRTTNSVGAVLERLGGNGVLLNQGLIQSWSDDKVWISVPYVPQTFVPIVPRLENKAGELEANGGKVQVSCGVIENDAGAVLVLADGIDQSGNAELDNAGEVDVLNGLAVSDTAVISNAANMTVLGGFNLSGGSVLSQGDGNDPVSVTVDTLAMSGGSVLSRGPWTVTGAFELDDGSFTESLYDSADPPILAADTLTQTGGQLTLGGARANVTGDFDLSGGTTSISATYGGTSLAAANINQTGGFLDNYNGLVAVSGAFNESAGTVQLNIAGVTVGSLWTIDPGAILYASHSGITGAMTNSGLIDVSLMNGPSVPGDYFNVGGDYTQTGSGTLILDANSSANDILHVSGTASLGGALIVRVPDGANPISLQLVTYGSLGGEFGSVSLPPGNWMLYYSPTSFNAMRMH